MVPHRPALGLLKARKIIPSETVRAFKLTRAYICSI